MDHGLRSNLLKVKVISVSLHTVERQISKNLTYVIRSNNDLTTSRGLLHICQANTCITAQWLHGQAHASSIKLKQAHASSSKLMQAHASSWKLRPISCKLMQAQASSCKLMHASSCKLRPIPCKIMQAHARSCMQAHAGSCQFLASWCKLMHHGPLLTMAKSLQFSHGNVA